MKALSIGSFDSFWKVSLLCTGAVAWALPTWNVVVNPYQIFSEKHSIGTRYTSSTTNERHLKVEHLVRDARERSPLAAENIVSVINESPKERQISKRELPNSFIVGSSIMGMIEPSLMEARIPGTRFYNLAFLAAKPDEILATLKGLKHEGMAINNIVYGLEPIAFTDIKSYGPAYQLHPLADENSKQKVLFDYLFASSLSDGFSRLVTVLRGEPSVRYDIEGTGRYYLDRYDHEIERDHEAFIHKQFPINPKPSMAPPWIENRFSEFNQLVQWLKQEKVNVRFYLNPLHPYVANAYGEDRLHEFKQRMAELAGQANLNDCTRLLSDEGVNQRFYDYKHFRDVEAGKVLDCGLNIPQSSKRD
jgi:hypothetical protein